MTKVILSLDIGGTKINGALVDAKTLRIVYRAKKISSKPHQKQLLPAIAATVDALRAQAQQHRWNLIGCGAVVAGQVWWPSGVVRWSPNINMRKRVFPLRRWLANRCHAPTMVDNDVHGFLLGECALGSTRTYPLVVAITLGTGIGGAIALDGQLIRGVENKAGEFGHTTIFPPNGLPKRCADGLPGHFEQYGSGQAIRQWYRLLSKQTPLLSSSGLPPPLARVGVPRGSSNDKRRGSRIKSAMTNGGFHDPRSVSLTTFEIEQRWYDHDPIAIAAVANVRSAIAQGLANIMIGLNPDAIILGGGLIRMKPLIHGLNAEVGTFLPFPVKTKILLSKLGDDAQLIGAATLV
ncbi:ROK family protein [Candidatus Uhrbacteria bacterium]|nr:ROK family protein [Candidatus Uhrbacteria bacterium]